MINSFKTLLNAISTKIDSEVKKASDWNKLRNKPFGGSETEIVIFPEYTFAHDVTPRSMSEEPPIVDFGFEVPGEYITIGTVYNVTINGKKYSNLVGYNDFGYISIGSPYGALTEELPFHIENGDDEWYMQILDERDSYTIEISKIQSDVKTIDEKYIPKEILRVKDIEEYIPYDELVLKEDFESMLPSNLVTYHNSDSSGKLILDWDGDSNGLDSFTFNAMKYCKISNATIPFDLVTSVYTVRKMNSGTYVATDFYMGEGCYNVGCAIVVYEAGVHRLSPNNDSTMFSFTAPSPGIYVLGNSNNYCIRLEIYGDFGAKYLKLVDANANDYYLGVDENGNLTFNEYGVNPKTVGDMFIVTRRYTRIDKTYDEILEAINSGKTVVMDDYGGSDTTFYRFYYYNNSNSNITFFNVRVTDNSGPADSVNFRVVSESGTTSEKELKIATKEYVADQISQNKQDGYTPVKGTDYFTEADKAELVNAVISALPSAEGVSF